MAALLPLWLSRTLQLYLVYFIFVMFNCNKLSEGSFSLRRVLKYLENKEQLGAVKLPLCTGSKEGSDLLCGSIVGGSIVGSLTLHLQEADSPTRTYDLLVTWQQV